MKILVGMSGGVDSSAAALILKQAGHEVIGATMTVWDNTESFRNLTGKGCFSPHDEDLRQAAAVCERLDIPHYVIDCTKEFHQTVLENFRSEYHAGRTPNPCVVCNSKIKFDILPNSAARQGVEFEKFATGHYAKLEQDEKSGFYRIRRGFDTKKDQSYFLYRLSQEQLSRVLFPLGDKSKDEIRQLAKQAGLEIAEKPDSQDFYTGALNDILQFADKEGNFVNHDGKILGRHKGYWNFTIGQRRGLGISADRPLYVIAIRPEANEVVLGYAEEAMQSSLIADDWVWQCEPPQDKLTVQARIRSSQSPNEAIVYPTANGGYRVDFMTPQSAITAGQSVVLYDGDLLLGGGIIEGQI